MKIKFSQDAKSLDSLRKFEAEFKSRTGRAFPQSNIEWEKLLADCGLTPGEIREIRTKDSAESEISDYYDPPGALLDLIYARAGVQSGKTDPDGGVEQFVTLLQMATIVGKSKRTLTRLYETGILPAPDIQGGDGQAHEWRWSVAKPILASKYNRQLPDDFPADRIIRSV